VVEHQALELVLRARAELAQLLQAEPPGELEAQAEVRELVPPLDPVRVRVQPEVRVLAIRRLEVRLEQARPRGGLGPAVQRGDDAREAHRGGSGGGSF